MAVRLDLVHGVFCVLLLGLGFLIYRDRQTRNMPLQVGVDYELGPQLGKGGYGTVWEVQVLKSLPGIEPGKYALKESGFSATRMSNNSHKVTLADDEARFLRKLKNADNVVTLYRSWQENNNNGIPRCRYFLLEKYSNSLKDYLYPNVTKTPQLQVWDSGEDSDDSGEYVDTKHNLATLVAQDATFRSINKETYKGRELLSPQTVWDFLSDIATGLQSVHKAGIVHLDLRAANICLKYDHNLKRDVCVIIDFGCAETEGNPVEGSYYMGGYANPPEVTEHGGTECRTSIDIWFFGQICLELLERTCNLSRCDSKDLRDLDCFDDRINNLVGVSDEWIDFLKSLLAIDYSNRPSIDDVRERLRTLKPRNRRRSNGQSRQMNNRRRRRKLLTNLL